MTEVTFLTQRIHSEALGDSQSGVHERSNGDNSSYLRQHFAEYTASQQLDIEKSRLRFLKSCANCKRPPPSLRIIVELLRF